MVEHADYLQVLPSEQICFKYLYAFILKFVFLVYMPRYGAVA